MRFTSRVLLFLLCLLPLLASCSGGALVKDKSLWICDDANFARFTHKDSIAFYLDKAKATGFNRVVVDVKGAGGYALFKSDFVPPFVEEGGVVCHRDWDYLETFIEEAHKRGMKVTAAATPFSVGCPMTGKGPCYDNPALMEHTCLEYLPSGMKKIEDDPAQVSAFLNPASEFGREYGLATIREIVSRYDIDGYCLDYCRYPGMYSDYSEESRKAFESYLGHEVSNFPQDIFTYGEDGEVVPGEYYRQWWTWRSGVIKSFIGEVRDMIQEVKPGLQLEYWAASWLHALYGNGQNWASENTTGYYEGLPWAEDTYNSTGFAESLDLFVTGTYLERVWGMDDLESIEYGLWRTKRDIGDACRIQGSLCAPNHLDQFDDAVYLCMKETSGVMVFDLVWVEKYDIWSKIKAGIDRAEKELAK